MTKVCRELALNLNGEQAKASEQTNLTLTIHHAVFKTKKTVENVKFLEYTIIQTCKRTHSLLLDILRGCVSVDITFRIYDLPSLK